MSVELLMFFFSCMRQQQQQQTAVAVRIYSCVAHAAYAIDRCIRANSSWERELLLCAIRWFIHAAHAIALMFYANFGIDSAEAKHSIKISFRIFDCVCVCCVLWMHAWLVASAVRSRHIAFSAFGIYVIRSRGEMILRTFCIGLPFCASTILHQFQCSIYIYIFHWCYVSLCGHLIAAERVCPALTQHANATFSIFIFFLYNRTTLMGCVVAIDCVCVCVEWIHIAYLRWHRKSTGHSRNIIHIYATRLCLPPTTFASPSSPPSALDNRRHTAAYIRII